MSAHEGNNVAQALAAAQGEALALPERPYAVIVANPFSGALANGRIVKSLVAALEARGLAGLEIWNPAQRHAVLQHPDLARNCRGIIAAGGDGTMADVINEMPAAPVAMLPLGTENLFARQFGFASDVTALASAVAAGGERRIDLGRIAEGGAGQKNPTARCGRRFSLMLSIGADAEVVRRLALWRAARKGCLRRVRRSSYVKPILATLMRYPYPALEVHADDQVVVGTHLFAFNLPRYGLGLTFAPQARADDGLLDWIVFQRPGLIPALRYTWAVAWQKHRRLPDVLHGQARKITVRSAQPAAVQIDGEAAGFTPVEMRVEPGVLRVIAMAEGINAA